MLSDDPVRYHTRGQTKAARSRYLEGSWQKIYWYSQVRTVIIRDLLVHLPIDFNLHPQAKKVKVQFSPETTAPHCVIDPLQFTDADPGRRLEVLISAYSDTGHKVQCWGYASVEPYGYANALVHWLNGVPLEK